MCVNLRSAPPDGTLVHDGLAAPAGRHVRGNVSVVVVASAVGEALDADVPLGDERGVGVGRGGDGGALAGQEGGEDRKLGEELHCVYVCMCV